jgi:hypothetical protein
MDWIHLAQDKGHLWALVCTSGFHKIGEFLDTFCKYELLTEDPSPWSELVT